MSINVLIGRMLMWLGTKTIFVAAWFLGADAIEVHGHWVHVDENGDATAYKRGPYERDP